MDPCLIVFGLFFILLIALVIYAMLYQKKLQNSWKDFVKQHGLKRIKKLDNSMMYKIKDIFHKQNLSDFVIKCIYSRETSRGTLFFFDVDYLYTSGNNANCLECVILFPFSSFLDSTQSFSIGKKLRTTERGIFETFMSESRQYTIIKTNNIDFDSNYALFTFHDIEQQKAIELALQIYPFLEKYLSDMKKIIIDDSIYAFIISLSDQFGLIRYHPLHMQKNIEPLYNLANDLTTL